jgi:hypothetical protein
MPFRPTRDLSAKRSAFADGARSGQLSGRDAAAWDHDLDVDPADWAAARMADIRKRAGLEADPAGETSPPASPATAAGRPPRPVIPGERQFRDGDRVRHLKWGEGIVVMSRLTRSDEEITVAFRDPQVGRKTLLGSLANLEIVG